MWLSDALGWIQEIIQSHMGYRREKERAKNPAPKKLIFFRGVLCHLSWVARMLMFVVDGVSEGQFDQVLQTGEQLCFCWLA